MGQFKPMVKMMTTEPSVILKLKKGGKVASKMDGGYMPMQSTMPAQAMPARGGLAPAASPMAPSMAARRRAMMAKPAMNPNMMKKGGKAEMHEDAAQDRAMIKKAMAGKKFATGGVVNGQGGFKKGGNVKMSSGGNIDDDVKNAKSNLYMQKDDDKVYSKVRGLGPGMAARRLEDRGVDVKGLVGNRANPEDRGSYKSGGIIKSVKGNTKMVTAKPDHSPAKTGGVKEGNGGGYADGGTIKGGNWENRPANTAKAGKTGGTTGGVRKGNAGGFKEGGATKKAYATGGTVDTGKPVAMPKKPVSKPIANSLQSGTFAKGGKVEKEEKPNLRLLMTHTGPKGHVAKVYKDKDWGEHRVKFFDPNGKHRSGSDYHTDELSDAHDTAKSQLNRYKQGGTAKRYEAGGTTVDASKGAYEKSIGPSEEDMDMAKAIRSIPSKLFQGAKSMMGMTPKPAGSVTKTEKSVTVAPASKKRGGGC
jgi:hypothetical protein